MWEYRLGLGNGPTSSLGPQLLLSTAGLVTADCPEGSRTHRRAGPIGVPNSAQVVVGVARGIRTRVDGGCSAQKWGKL